MIDYNAFHDYLVELVGMFQRTRSTKGMSQLAQKWHCTAITRDQFYQMKLDKLQADQVTPQLSRVVRDTIGKSDAKQTLRETIGALNEGILSGSRISQGSDRTVQITITQPVSADNDSVVYQQKSIYGYRALPDIFTIDDVCRCFQYDSLGSAYSRVKRFMDDYLIEKIRTGKDAGKYRKVSISSRFREGQVVLRKAQTGSILLLIDKMYTDSFLWHYGLSLNDTEELLSFSDDKAHSCPLNATEIRPAKGNEVARFLGALTRSGYEWTADNANGLFFVKQKQPKEQKPVEAFANDLPNGYHGIYALPAYQPSPYRFALRCVPCVDNAQQYMAESQQPPVVENAILRQLEAIDQGQGCDGIREYLEYDLPTVCCSENMREHRVAFVKVNNNGTSYWLARDRDVLRLLAWVAYII